MAPFPHILDEDHSHTHHKRKPKIFLALCNSHTNRLWPYLTWAHAHASHPSLWKAKPLPLSSNHFPTLLSLTLWRGRPWRHKAISMSFLLCSRISRLARSGQASGSLLCWRSGKDLVGFCPRKVWRAMACCLCWARTPFDLCPWRLVWSRMSYGCDSCFEVCCMLPWVLLWKLGKEGSNEPRNIGLPSFQQVRRLASTNRHLLAALQITHFFSFRKKYRT